MIITNKATRRPTRMVVTNLPHSGIRSKYNTETESSNPFLSKLVWLAEWETDVVEPREGWKRHWSWLWHHRKRVASEGQPSIDQAEERIGWNQLARTDRSLTFWRINLRITTNTATEMSPASAGEANHEPAKWWLAKTSTERYPSDIYRFWQTQPTEFLWIRERRVQSQRWLRQYYVYPTRVNWRR